jgi:hypothetical protein
MTFENQLDITRHTTLDELNRVLYILRTCGDELTKLEHTEFRSYLNPFWRSFTDKLWRSRIHVRHVRKTLHRFEDVQVPCPSVHRFQFPSYCYALFDGIGIVI